MNSLMPSDEQGSHLATLGPIKLRADAGTMPFQRKAVVVLGMHRSGTSAFTRVISLLGADLPKLLNTASSANPKGFFEPEKIIRIHEEMLASIGSTWDDFFEFPAAWYESDSARSFRERILEILREEYGASRFFVLKEPRICRVVPLWLEVLAEFGATPYFIIPVRNPLEVAGSLKVRDNFPTAKSLLLWLRHVLDAELHTRGRARTFVRYEKLLDDWHGTMRKIAHDLDLKWTSDTHRTHAQIEAFLCRDDRHHSISLDDLEHRAEIPVWLKQAYRAVLAAADGDESALSGKLDAIRSELTSADLAFGPIVAEQQLKLADVQTDLLQLRRQADEQGRQLAESQARIAQREAELAQRTAQIEQLQNELAARQGELAERVALVGRLQADFAQRTARTEQLQGEWTTRQAEWAERVALVERLQTELAGQSGQAADREEELAARRAELAQQSQRIKELETELAARQAELAQNSAQVERLHGELAARRDELTARQTELAARQEELAERTTHVQRLEAELATMQAELAERSASQLAQRQEIELAQRREAELTRRLEVELARRREAEETRQRELHEAQRKEVARAADAATGSSVQMELDGLRSALAARASEAAQRGERVHALEQQLVDRAASVAYWRTSLAAVRARSESVSTAVARLCWSRQAAEASPVTAARRAAGSVLRALRGALVLRGSKRRALIERRQRILQSGLFDVGYYLMNNPDLLALPDIDPVEHFLQYGAAEGRRPCALFDLAYYVQAHPELAESGANPLEHYLECGAQEGRRPNPLFDTAYYLARYSDVAESGINPLAHYVQQGVCEGRRPNPLFDTRYYLAENPDVAAAGTNPLEHFLERGAAEGRRPNPLFDTAYYVARYPDVATALNPLAHYLDHGAAEGRQPNPLFDTRYYLAHNEDVAASGQNPLAHYLDHGAGEGRKPNPLFDTRYYLAANPDVALSGRNPLEHFLRCGAAEGRKPNPLFDTRYYLAQNPEVAAEGINPLAHFLERGAAEGRRPCVLFDSAYYLAKNPDVGEVCVNPLAHYLEFGAAEGRQPNPLFDPRYYRERNPDVALTGTDPLAHFLEYGAAEGRKPNPLFDPHYYLAENPDVAASGSNPLVHFLKTGATERRKPCPLFDTGYYLVMNPDVAVTGMNPLAHYLEFGWKESRNPSDRFDTVYYLASNPDVVRLGMNPLAHYVEFGRAEKRDPISVYDTNYYHVGPGQAAPLKGHVPSTRVFRVLFVDGLGPVGESSRYRVDNVREALALLGIGTEKTYAEHLAADLNQIRLYDMVVLFRAGWNIHVARIVQRARAWGIPVVCDVDDYVFEPRIATPEIVAGIRGWPPEQVQQYVDGVNLYRKTLLECDYFTGSTDYLAERARELGRPSFVINNALSQALLDVSRQQRAGIETRPNSGRVEIVYLSGTKTHQRDFEVVAPVLAEIMHERPQVQLRIVGHLNLEEFAELQPFRQRIARCDFVPWRELPALVRTADINIAPLEVGNPFCEAKSELKFFECAAFGVVTVASATDPFRRAILDGETGFVCATREQWREKLLRLIDDEGLRKRMTRSAAQFVVNRYGPSFTAKQALAVYEQILSDTRQRREIPARSLVVDWLVPTPSAGSGGHKTIFYAANEMARRGHHVTVRYDSDPQGIHRSDPKGFIERHFGITPGFEVALSYEPGRCSDVLLATHYSTVAPAVRMQRQCYLPAYCVQDFEPYFDSVGTGYVTALNTYRQNLYCITTGHWLTDVLRKQFGMIAQGIDFWMDRRYYYPRRAPPGTQARRTVAFFARPYMPRRCYPLGIAALSLLHKKLPDVEIVFFGTQDVGDVFIDFPYRLLGLTSLEDLGNLYRTADAGLAFSTTNPSLVNFEMMACGLPVVDLDVMDSRARHDGVVDAARRPHSYPALLVEPTPQALCDAIAALLDDRERLAQMSGRGMEFAAAMPSPEESIRQFCDLVEKGIYGQRVD